MQSLLADPWWEDAAGLAMGFFMLVIVPLVAILLHHQRKMAAFFHIQAAQENQQDKAQIDRLESRVAELSDRINQLILQHDDKSALQERVGPPKLPDQLAR
ncbi:MAG: hypothetical protein ACHQ50_01440 [Fimbriimonadales bacterium]